MATDPKKKKKEDEEEDDDPFENWDPSQPIPDDEGEEAAKRKAIVEQRAEYLKTHKKKKKRSTGLWGG
jgi:hypothetical protein